MSRNLNDSFNLTAPVGLSKNDNVRALSKNMAFDNLGTFVEERQRIERKLTQIYDSEPRVDFSHFANHVTFDSAVSKFEIAKDRILTKYPFNGDSETQDLYAISSSLYERYVVNQWPTCVGYAYYDSGNAYVTASDYASNLYVGPSQSLYVSARIAPALPSVTNTVLSVLSGSSLGHYYGYTLFATDTSMTFRVLSGALQYDYTGYFPTASIRNQMTDLAVMYDANAQTLSMYQGAARKYFQPLSMGNRLTFGPATVSIGSSFSGAIGEIRLLLTASDAYHAKFYNRPITSEDFVQLNYRFNEGITGVQAYDQNVIDYSQSRLHGQVVNFTSSFRRSGSTALNDPGDPILYPTHPAVVAYTSSQETSASYYDDLNKSYMLRLIPEDILEDDQSAGGLYTAFSLAMSRFFDELKMYFDQSDNLRVVSYTGNDEAPDLMLPFMKKYFGWKATDHFSDSNPLQFFFGEDVTNDGSIIMPLVDIKNQFWRRILQNLPYLLKTKGKRRNIEAFFNVLGINAGNLNLKEFGTAVPSTIADEWISKEKEVSCLNLTGSGAWSLDYSNNQDQVTVEVMHAVSPLAAQASDVFYAFGDNPVYVINLTIPTPLSGATYSLQFVGGSNRSFKASATPETAQQILGALTVGANIGTNLSANISGTGNSAVLTVQSLNSLNVGYTRITAASHTQEFAVNARCFPPLSGAPGSVVFNTPDGPNVIFNNPPIFNGEMAHYSVVCNSGSVTYGLRQYYNGGLYSTSSTLTTNNPYTGSLGTTIVFGAYSYSYGSFMEGRVWSSGLRQKDLDAHACDYLNVGEKTYLQGSASALSARYPFSQDFNDASGNGNNLQVYEATTNTNIFGTRFIEYGFLSPTFDLKWTQNKVRTYQSSSLRADQIGRDTNQIALEFNLVDSLNEDISHIFSTMSEMNTVIGAPVNKYRDGYVELEAMRDIYFQRLTDSLNFTNFFKLFRWFDKKLSNSIKQLVPARADFIGGEFVVDSHMFERNKYQYLYPVFHTPKDIDEGAVSVGNATGASQGMLDIARAMRGTSVRNRDEQELKRYGRRVSRDDSVVVEAAIMPRVATVSSPDYCKPAEAPAARLPGFKSFSNDGTLSSDSSNFRFENQQRIYNRRQKDSLGLVSNPSVSNGLWTANGFVFSDIDSDNSDLHYSGLRKSIELRLLGLGPSNQNQFSCGPSAVVQNNPITVLADGQNFPLDPTYQGCFTDWSLITPRVNAMLTYSVSASYTNGNAGFNPADFVVQYADGSTLQWPSYSASLSTGNLTWPYGILRPIKDQPGWYKFMMTLNGLDAIGVRSTQTSFSLTSAASGFGGASAGFRIMMQNTLIKYAFKDLRVSFYAPLTDAGVRFFTKMGNSHVSKKIVYRNASPFKQAGELMPNQPYVPWSTAVLTRYLPDSQGYVMIQPDLAMKFDKNNVGYAFNAYFNSSTFQAYFSFDKTYDYGQSFQHVAIFQVANYPWAPEASQAVQWCLDPNDSNTIYIAASVSTAGANYTTYFNVSKDGGNTFLGSYAVVNTAVTIKCIYKNSSVYWLTQNALYRSTYDSSGDASFFTLSSTTALQDSQDFEFDYSGNIYASSQRNGVYRSTDGGYTFSNVLPTTSGTLGSGSIFNEMTCCPNGYVYAIGSLTTGNRDMVVFSSSTGNAGTWGKTIFAAGRGTSGSNSLNYNNIVSDSHSRVFTSTGDFTLVRATMNNGAGWSLVDYRPPGISVLYSMVCLADDTILAENFAEDPTYAYFTTRRGKATTNLSYYGPRSLAPSSTYVQSSSIGAINYGYLLGNVSEFPHFGGLYQMKNLVLGTTTQGTIGVNDDSIVQIKHVGSVVGVMWPDQTQLAAPVPGFGELSPGQSPGKTSTAFTFGQAFDCTAHDHVSLYCYALKQTSGTLEDVQIQIQRRPLSSVGFATDQSVEYSPSGSITEARYKDIYHTKQIDYGDMTNTAISYVIDVPLTNVRELRIGVRQKIGQVDVNQNFLVWGRFIDSKTET